jgi:glycosyltransferase involved in cell wall biosynthesis
MSVRIGINSLFLVPGDVGGTEIYFRRTLLPLINRNPDAKFVFFTTKDNDTFLKKDFSVFPGVTFVKLNFRASCRPLRIIAEQTLLPILVKKEQVDLFWSPGYTVPVVCHCPQVVTVHDLQYKSHPEDLSFLERLTLDFLVRTACRRCEVIITISDFSRSEIVGYNMASDDKVKVIYEGVEPEFARRDDDRSSIVRMCPSLPIEGPYILCVAHSYPHKKVHVLIDAFRLVQDSIPHHLVLVGRARRGEEKLQKSLERMSDNTRVHRLHGLAFHDLKSLYQHADLFVLPSVYEGFGLPVLEAMMAGVPVITTSMASLPEVGGNYAVYVDSVTADGFARSIIDVLGWEGKFKEQRVVAARKWAETFTWKKTADSTMQVFKQVVQTQ